MRRPEKTTSGVIRPRTLGLGRVATTPPPAPPPPPPAPSLLDNRKVRLSLLVGVLLFCMVFLFRRGDEKAVAGSEHGDDQALRNSPPLLDSDEGEEDDGDKRPSKSILADDEEDGESGESGEDGKHETEGDDEEPHDDEEDDSKASKEDGEDEESSSVTHEEEAAPITRKEVSGDSNQDRSKSVQSYFDNFGGRAVEIDREGSYKYVLVRMEDIFGSQALLVRGCPHKEGTHCKHSVAFSRAKAELELRGFKATVLGGGRITRHPSRHQKGQKEGYISIFGFSKTYGACEDCNKLTCTLVRTAFPDHGVKWANEGYLESDEKKIRNDAWTRC